MIFMKFAIKNIEMLQWYYNFLYLWKFLEAVIVDNDLSQYANDLKVDTSNFKSFILKWKKIQNILSSIYKHPNKKNVFGFVTELSVFKGILGIMREIIENDEDFRIFIEKKMRGQFFPFEQIIRFSRNVLLHSFDSKVSLKREDYIKQKEYLLWQDKHKIILSFKYADNRMERKGSQIYGIRIQVDFSKLKSWQSFFEVISVHDLYLLSELCFNLSELFKWYRR